MSQGMRMHTALRSACATFRGLCMNQHLLRKQEAAGRATMTLDIGTSGYDFLSISLNQQTFGGADPALMSGLWWSEPVGHMQITATARSTTASPEATRADTSFIYRRKFMPAFREACRVERSRVARRMRYFDKSAAVLQGRLHGVPHCVGEQPLSVSRPHKSLRLGPPSGGGSRLSAVAQANQRGQTCQRSVVGALGCGDGNPEAAQCRQGRLQPLVASSIFLTSSRVSRAFECAQLCKFLSLAAAVNLIVSDPKILQQLLGLCRWDGVGYERSASCAVGPRIESAEEPA